VLQDKSTSLILELNKESPTKDLRNFAKVHPIEVELPKSTIVPRIGIKEESEGTFWSRFKTNPNRRGNEGVRKFSILDPKSGVMVP
jgi:hypothetical protein